MSTKIYDGMIFTDHPSMYALNRRFSFIREEIQELFRKKYNQSIITYAVDLIDKKALGQPLHVNATSFPRKVITEACSRVEERWKKIKKTGLRDPDFDFYAEVSVFPLRNKMLMMPFIENREALELLKRQPWIKPYGYWDNVDPDESCSPREWEQRKKDWHKALPGIGVPSQCGFSVQLHASFIRWPSIAEMRPLTPTYKARVREQAKSIAFTNLRRIKYKKMKKNMKDQDGQVDLRMRAAHQAIIELDTTEEGKRLKKEAVSFVRERLPKRITKAMLMEKIAPTEDAPA